MGGLNQPFAGGVAGSGPQPVSVPVSAAGAAALEGLSAALSAIAAGASPNDPYALMAGLHAAAAIVRMFQYGGASGGSAFVATLTPISTAGRSVLSIEGGGHSFHFQMDAFGRLFAGVWHNPNPGAGPYILSFFPEACPEGWNLRVEMPTPVSLPVGGPVDGWTLTPLFQTRQDNAEADAAAPSAGAGVLAGLLKASKRPAPEAAAPPYAPAPAPAAPLPPPASPPVSMLAPEPPLPPPPGAMQPEPETRLSVPSEFPRSASPLKPLHRDAADEKKTAAGGWTLTIQNGPAAGKAFPLHGNLRIGRGVQCEIPLPDDLASRLHAEISVTEQGCSLKDLNSTNGTVVDGVRIRGTVALSDGSVIRCGRTEMTIKAPVLPELEETLIMNTAELTKGFVSQHVPPDDVSGAGPAPAAGPAPGAFAPAAPPPVFPWQAPPAPAGRPPEPALHSPPAAPWQHPPAPPPPPPVPRAPEQKAGPAFCTSCGAPLRGTPKFCGQCGSPVRR